MSPIHNQAITAWATNSRGETLFFLPAFGYLLLIMATGLFLLHHWDKVKEVGWGDRRVVGCLLFIVLAISLSGANYTGWQDRIAPLGMGIVLFGLYATARVLGRELHLPLLIGALFAILGVLVMALVRPGKLTGGLVFEWNYDIVVGYIILGVLLFPTRWQWVAVSLALIGLFLSGSPEGVFTVAVLGVAVLFRQDWGWKLAVAIVPVIIVASIWFSLGWGQQLYSYTWGLVTGEPDAYYTSNGTYKLSEIVPDDVRVVATSAIGARWMLITRAMSDLRPLGEGYSVTVFNNRTVHNVPLVIVQQLGYPGILAGMAWLFISIRCLVKTKWKYAWVAVLALAIWDHYLWTQIGYLWWVIVGASTTDNLKSDLIFRKTLVT